MGLDVYFNILEKPNEDTPKWGMRISNTEEKIKDSIERMAGKDSYEKLYDFFNISQLKEKTTSWEKLKEIIKDEYGLDSTQYSIAFSCRNGVSSYYILKEKENSIEIPENIIKECQTEEKISYINFYTNNQIEIDFYRELYVLEKEIKEAKEKGEEFIILTKDLQKRIIEDLDNSFQKNKWVQVLGYCKYAEITGNLLPVLYLSY